MAKVKDKKSKKADKKKTKDKKQSKVEVKSKEKTKLKVKVAVEDKPAKKSKNKPTSITAASINKMRHSIYDAVAMMDQEEKSSKVSSMGGTGIVDPQYCISTGLLALDLSIGGGLMPGKWYTIWGGESGGKSTLLYSTIAQAYRMGIQSVLEDYEGTFDGIWFANICGVKTHREVFGLRNKKTGEWEITPQARLYRPDDGESGLFLMKRILKRMPDKVLMGDEWFYVFPAKKENLSKYAAKKNGKANPIAYNNKLYSKTGLLYVQIPENYGGPEAVFSVDSFATMIPRSVADSEEEAKAMAQQARMFSQYCTDIRNLAAKKGAIVIGSNQKREKPGQMYGSPEYSSGGNAIKHATDCRVKVTPVGVIGGKGAVEFEGSDEYRYAKFKAEKNKLFVPHKEAQTRWWTGRKGTSGNGVDPVYDTYQYLQMTGQVYGTKRGFKIDKAIDKSGTEYKWAEFKKAILDPKNKMRERCTEQLKTSKGMQLYLNSTKDVKEQSGGEE